jgi:hypothetical protein
MTELLTDQNIRTELEAAGLYASDTDRLVVWVLNRARRVFMTLVWIENVEAIESLLQFNFNDSCLPLGISRSRFPTRRFRWVVSSLRDQEKTFSVFQDQKISSQSKPPPWSAAFNKWRPMLTEAFADKQWLFLAPIFTPATLKYRFDKECPLPFLTTSDQGTKFGPFSSVYRVELHRAHQQKTIKVYIFIYLYYF